MNFETSAQEMATEISRQTERIILEQLNELISRNLLVVKSTQPVLVKSFGSDRVEIKQHVRLVLRDKEYIEKLEKENAELSKKLSDIALAIEGIVKHGVPI